MNDWEMKKQRYEAFWNGGIIDRPLISVSAPLPPSEDDTKYIPRPVGNEEAVYDWYTNPETVFSNCEYSITHRYYAGDAFPAIFPMATNLPAIQAAYMGGNYHIDPTNGSGWCNHALCEFDDYKKTFYFDPDNKWWMITKQLLDLIGSKIAGKAFIGIPDIQGGGQILDSLRGTENLLLDFFDKPEKIKEMMPIIDSAWEKYWTECNDITLKYQEGYLDWLGLWSSKPMVTVECDLSVMISPEQFNQFFLPSLKKQIDFVDRSIYHLDGAGQLCHLDTLLAIDNLDGIQWVPEPCNRDIRKFMAMLKKIRSAGKFVVLTGCVDGVDTVKMVLNELGPEGVFISLSCASPEEADEIVNSL